ncbi:hypothetical protein [uncultured Bacteroides sp.]|uniref:hypothetical protein n=1 Tax=uncultured Bacteroides sp. TaxID=162156 RepID=UPI002AA940CE|nr:hypothetical protein [uncultured Bacteroides sp.]
MRKLTYVLITLCLALYSCGMTDVWKDWESEGIPNPDRLKPSEVKSALCASDGWKLNYKGHDFYFQFSEDGTVAANSDYTILDETVYTTYRFNSEGDNLVLLTIEGGGHLSSLGDDDSEDTYLVSAVSDSKITCKGKKNGDEMDLVAVSAAEIKSQIESKSLLLSMKNNGFLNGVIRDANDRFVAHYAISTSDNMIRFITLENRLAIHQESSLNIDGGTFTFSGITLEGQSVSKLTYNSRGDGFAALEGVDGLTVTSNKDVVDYFNGTSYKTYKISKNNNLGDAKDELFDELGWSSLGDVEISDRTKRPLVFCPSGADSFWYLFFDSMKDNDPLIKGELDRVYFTRSDGYMPYGGDLKSISEANIHLAKFLAAWFDEDGLYLVRESDGSTDYIYFLSPTTDSWFKIQK